MDSPQPLHFPSPWPPPASPEGESSMSALRYIPIIGRVVGWWQGRRRWAAHVSRVLMPIERQIVDQLAMRPRMTLWSNSPSRHQTVAQLMATAVAQEKGLSPVTVHPDDPVELLFWGAVDDMSLLRFALHLEKECGIVLSIEDAEAFFNKHMTVSEVIAFCLAKDPALSTGQTRDDDPSPE